MALLHLEELPQRSSEVTDTGVRKYSRTYRMEFDEPTEGPFTAGAAAGLNFWDTWDAGETDPAAWLRSASFKQVEDVNGYIYICTYNYSNEAAEIGSAGTGSTPGNPGETPGDAGQNQPPEDRPWVVSMDSVEVSVPVEEDAVDGSPIVNTVGQPFDPPLERPNYHLQFTITGFKTWASESWTNCLLYQGKVNNATWWDFGADTLLCKKYGLTTQKEHGTRYWAKTVVLELNVDKWNPTRILNRGTLMLESATLPPQPIKDKNGNPISAPVPLSAAGQPLTGAEIAGGASFHWIEKNIYKRTSYATIL